MKYWRLYNSAEKEVGFVPQIVEPVFEGYYTDNNQLWNTYSKKIDENTIIPKGHLQKKAKVTDLMSVGFASGNLFLSDKLHNIFGNYCSEGVQFADTGIFTKNGDMIKANIIHPFFTDHSFLDIPQCEFQLSNAMGNDVYDIVKFNSFAEFRTERQKLINESKNFEDINLHKWLSILKLTFKESTDFGLCSVFDVTYGSIGFYVSQSLKDEILNEKCTGMIFREINERYP